MPLNDSAINEILPFAAEGLEAAGDLLTLEEYKAHTMRLRGHMPGLALRGLQNRASRQSAHVVAGLAQFIANRYAPGVVDDGDLDKVEQGLLDVISALIAEAMPQQYDISMTLDYFLCTKIFKFIHPTAKAGMVPVNGTLIANAVTRYPQAFAYLQSAEGQLLCTTETNWQAANVAVWATLASGEQVGWDGIGGVCKYVIDTNAGTIRVPDLRGMSDEVAGFDSLGVGGVHGDASRNIVGTPSAYLGNANYQTASGAFVWSGQLNTSIVTGGGGGHAYYAENFDLSRVGPVANKMQTRAWGAFACVYLGKPAS